MPTIPPKTFRTRDAEGNIRDEDTITFTYHGANCPGTGCPGCVPREEPTPTLEAEPLNLRVVWWRDDDAPESERIRAVVKLLDHGQRAPDGGVCIGLGVAATPEEAERQAREDAKGRLGATGEGL